MHAAAFTTASCSLDLQCCAAKPLHAAAEQHAGRHAAAHLQHRVCRAAAAGQQRVHECFALEAGLAPLPRVCGPEQALALLHAVRASAQRSRGTASSSHAPVPTGWAATMPRRGAASMQGRLADALHAAAGQKSNWIPGCSARAAACLLRVLASPWHPGTVPLARSVLMLTTTATPGVPSVPWQPDWHAREPWLG